MSNATHHIFVTRPEPDNRRTCLTLKNLLPEHGFKPVAMPLFERSPLDYHLPSAADFDAIAITSANAIRTLQNNPSIAQWIGLPLFAVGDRTAEVARQAGFTRVISANANLKALVKLIEENPEIRRVFYPTAAHRSGDLQTRLSEIHIETVIQTIYEMTAISPDPQTWDLLRDGSQNAVLVYSHRASQHLVGLFQTANVSASPTFICLSQNVADPLHEAGFFQLRLADTPTEQAIMEATLDWVLSSPL